MHRIFFIFKEHPKDVKSASLQITIYMSEIFCNIMILHKIISHLILLLVRKGYIYTSLIPSYQDT